MFTDIEGSTRLAEALGPRDWVDMLERHRQLLRAAWARHSGVEVMTEGDGFFVTFESASDALAAAADAQRALAREPWRPGQEVRVRIGVHTGEAVLTDGGYVGHDIHRAARIGAAGYGGQILVSDTTAALVAERPPPGTSFRALGTHRLKDLQPQELCQLVVDGLPNDFPMIRSAQGRTKLPTQLTSFVGREREMTEVAEALERSRLVTLTGPGGTGKTRLSIQVAAEIADRFRDGVSWVPLAVISDPDLVASAIATAVGALEGRGQSPLERLVDSLRERDVLLVLDNFEQVARAAPLLADLLRGAPGVRMLVSSRLPLRIYGEQEYPVAPLSTATGGSGGTADGPSDAVRLFVERARAVRPGLSPDLLRSPAVSEIVARLDGLPLAIELAAARSRLLTPEAMLPRLERRLDLLSSGERDRPERQQTLRGAIAWSHELLDAPEQRLFARLAVFVPAATMDQIEAVCGPADELGRDVLDTLDGLVGHSLVRQIDTGGEPRFGMLATIREYAAERLDLAADAAAIRDRHLAAYVELAEAAGRRLTRDGGRKWLDRLEDEHDNMRAAFGWAGERGDNAARLRLVAALWRFWQIRGHLAEGLARAETALSEEADTTDVIRLAALDAAGGLAYWVGNFVRAVHWYRKALDVRRQIGGDATLAEGMYNLAFPMAFGQIDVDQVPAVAGEALERYRRSGDEAGEAKALWLLANVEDESGDTTAARGYGLEALPILERLGDSFLLGWCLFTIGQLDARDGDLEGAMGRLRPALELFSSVGDQSGLVLVLDTMAAVAWLGNDRIRAARLAGAVARLEGTTGTGLNQWTRRRVGWDPAVLREDPATAAAWRTGEADDDQAIVAYALGTMGG